MSFTIYGEHVKAQVRSVGSMKEKMVDDNSIAYAMSVAEDVIATDVDCIVGGVRKDAKGESHPDCSQSESVTGSIAISGVGSYCFAGNSDGGQ